MAKATVETPYDQEPGWSNRRAVSTGVPAKPATPETGAPTTGPAPGPATATPAGAPTTTKVTAPTQAKKAAKKAATKKKRR